MDAIKAEYEELTQKIKKCVPIKAYPTRELVISLREKHPNITLKSEILIKDVMNSGDITGILCITECREVENLACALTHVIIASSEPLKVEIEKYQRKRAKRLSKQITPGWN